MGTASRKSEPEPAPPKFANAKAPDIAAASVDDTLAALRVDPETGLARAEVEVRRREHGYNEVIEKKATRLSISEQPYQAVIDTAKAKGCDLIVMASHGRHGISAIVLGSETVKVLTHSKVPVLVHR